MHSQLLVRVCSAAQRSVVNSVKEVVCTKAYNEGQYILTHLEQVRPNTTMCFIGI